jgi:RNA polymerase sigma factor (sigma-70 family)
MKNPIWTDQDILQMLRSRDAKSVNNAFKQLYQDAKLRGTVLQQVRALGGNEDDAREMFNMALLAFDKSVQEGTYDSTRSQITTYIVNIAKQMYHTRRRSEIRRVAMYDRSVDAGITETQTNPEKEMTLQHKKQLLDQAMAGLSEKCRQALKLNSMDYSMAEIAEMMQYRSPDVAKMAVRDCRGHLHTYLTERPTLLAELRAS